MSCTDKNPLTREGTSQLTRMLAALDVHYANVDERRTQDLLLFAKRYAEHLNYYNGDNLIDGTWQPLMMMDVSVTLATITKIDVRRISDYKKLLYKKITLATSDSNAKMYFKFLFDVLFSLVTIINKQYKLLPDSFEYKAILKDIISGKLQFPLANIEKFFNDFKTGLLDYSVNQLDSDAPVDVFSDENFDRINLDPAWQTAGFNLPITIPLPLTVSQKIVYIINHNLYNSAIETLLRGVATIVDRAKDLFEKTLKDFPQHSPHYALFLTFTKLFKTAQDDLNRYTQRHLDFYYKDVLQLKNKLPQADEAYLSFELQKPFAQHLLEKDILFKGGKDVTGKEINYKLVDNVALNKATITKIQSQQINLENNGPLKSFEIANSADGYGAKLLSADKSWFTFGNSKNKPTDKAGFAIASNILFLAEGTRDVTVTVAFSNNIPELVRFPDNTWGGFEALLTGKKDWIEKTVSSKYNDGLKQLTFSFSLNPNDPAIIPYTEKIHKENFETYLPLLKIYLKQGELNTISYKVLCSNKIDTIKIDVQVTGVKDLVLSSDTGSIDASKPFKPFGDFPPVGAGFYIGSKEIFQKKISELSFDFPEDSSFNNSTFYLNEAKWKPFTNLSGKKIAGINAETATIDFTANENLKATSLNGFIKLTNTNDKSIGTYLTGIKTALDETTLHLIDTSKPLDYQLTVGQTPSPPEIKISNFSLNYNASVTIDLTTQDGIKYNNLFFHLTPFGYAEIFNAGIIANETAEKILKYSLVTDIVNDGELMIGLENAEPDIIVTILFQLAEGSSNPEKDMEEVLWYYLSDNTWFAFEKRNVVDDTNNFTQSGIVTLTFPRHISNQNTLHQKGLHWIKAAVFQNVDAVCEMILIQAQAARVELVQDDEQEIEFREILQANSISKLVNSDAAVKSITQPFDSLNGRMRESDGRFYVRVSERLRHKQRAITVWDYEHILLEQFPQLYKIKCLNHSGFYSKNNEEIFCENFPGHVTIVPLPDLKNNIHANLLRPNTPIGLLNNIAEYLRKLTSPFVKPLKTPPVPFVKLHVKNPQFEEIQLDFKVSFYKELDESFYKKLLNNEIEKFLCPWAFADGKEISFGGKISKSTLLNF
ncbi:MAG: hypothetical protein ABI325_02815, partial [Ginsengibacter sp.]